MGTKPIDITPTTLFEVQRLVFERSELGIVQLPARTSIIALTNMSHSLAVPTVARK